MKLRPVDVPGSPTHDLDVAISYDIADRRVVEIAFVTRGKVGGGLDLMFSDLGMQLSRALQGRSPETGEPSSHSALNLKNQVYGFSDIAELAPFNLSTVILRERLRFRSMSAQEKAALIQAIQIESP